jgi:uncharacterized protein YcbX
VTASKLTVSELWVYPIKSCKGTRLEEATVDVTGLKNDRRYMVVDARTGMFVAQRGDREGVGIKRMCLIAPKNRGDGDNFELSAPGMENIRFSAGLWDPRPSNIRQVQVWKTQCDAIRCTDSYVNHWLSEFLSAERPGHYELVQMSDRFIRRADVGYSQLRFADSYPFLVISQESLDDLNQRIGGEPLPMNRFRPNIVIKGEDAYIEDRADRMIIDGVDFEGMDLCVRCATTTTNQDSAERGKEPLKTLATYRRYAKGGVTFGRNFNHLSTGKIRVGDEVRVLQYNPPDRA